MRCTFRLRVQGRLTLISKPCQRSDTLYFKTYATQTRRREGTGEGRNSFYSQHFARHPRHPEKRRTNLPKWIPRIHICNKNGTNSFFFREIAEIRRWLRSIHCIPSYHQFFCPARMWLEVKKLSRMHNLGRSMRRVRTGFSAVREMSCRRRVGVGNNNQSFAPAMAHFAPVKLNFALAIVS